MDDIVDNTGHDVESINEQSVDIWNLLWRAEIGSYTGTQIGPR